MQTITAEMAAILKARLQAGADGFRGRIEIDRTVPGGQASLVQENSAPSYAQRTSFIYDNVPTPGNLLVATFYWSNGPADLAISGWDAVVTPISFPLHLAYRQLGVYTRVAQVGDGTTFAIGTNVTCRYHLSEWSGINSVIGVSDYNYEQFGVTTVDAVLDPSSNSPMVLYCAGLGLDGDTPNPDDLVWTTDSVGLTELAQLTGSEGFLGVAYAIEDVAADTYTVTLEATNGYAHGQTGNALIVAGLIADASQNTLSMQAVTIDADKGLRVAADQVRITLTDESYALGWGPESVFTTNQRLRVYQWYGDTPDNEILSFTGLIDEVVDERDGRLITITCRDMMAVLIDQTFSSTAPQREGETGAVRTPENGVYLDMEIDAIVADILDRAGYPAADRVIGETSFSVSQFIIDDGQSWADALSNLAALISYSSWADELGVYHFEPSFIEGSVSDPQAPVYTFRAGEDITSLSDATDQYDLRTRVKVRGPLVALRDSFRKVWATRKIYRPLDVWYDSTATPKQIRVLDKSTKRLYRLRDSDRKILGYTYLGAVMNYPAAVSGDPSNSAIYWVLTEQEEYGQTGNGHLKKVRKSDNKVLADYQLPAGRWTAMKVSGSWIWLAEWNTDKIYRASKSNGSILASYSHSYWVTDPGIGPQVAMTNPKSLMIDGTTLWVFWTNGDTLGRWLVVDESTPTTIDNAVYMAGTKLFCCEWDTSAGNMAWGVQTQQSVVAKFRFYGAFDQLIYDEVIDQDLEDELGLAAQLDPRVHDVHSGDGAHPYEVRRETWDVPMLASLAQATETATNRLELLAHRRRILDAGVIGNPALQKLDIVKVEDPVTGISRRFMIDTYRTSMAESYVGVIALIPIDEPDDEPVDDGDATQDGTVEIIGFTTASEPDAVTQITIDVPAGVQDDDVLILRVFTDNDGGAQAISGGLTGWTQVGSDNTQLYFTKPASSEPASYTPTVASSTHMAAIMVAMRGIDTTTPVAAFGYAAVTSETTPESPAVTVSSGTYVRLVGVQTDRGDETITLPTDFEALDAVDTGGTGSTEVAGALAYQFFTGSNPAAAEWTLSAAAASDTAQLVLNVP